MLRRVATIVVGGAILVGVVGAAYWAGTNAVVPPALPVEDHALQTYTVEAGTVARSIRVPVTASWSTTRTLFAGTDGVVTSVAHGAGAYAEPGDVIATVDLEPLVVATGAVPMFRTLRQGVEGPDVAQFQRLLRTLGFYRGSANGRFGAATVTATKRWQRSVGAEDDGIVATGSLLFVDSLPARLEVLAVVGQRIGAGSDLVRVLDDSPDFVATVGGSQRAELTSGTPVAIGAPGGGTWPGVLGSFDPLDDGRYSVEITGGLCGGGCDLVPVGDETALTGTIELVPQTTGVVVPTSALVQQPSGDLAVTLTDGTVRRVRVVAEADGFAVVEGLEPGTIIQLPSAPGP